MVKKIEQRQLQKALLRYHDKSGWQAIRHALTQMGLERLIGDGPNQLVPAEEKPTARKGHSHKAPGKQRAKQNFQKPVRKFNKPKGKPKQKGQKPK